MEPQKEERRETIFHRAWLTLDPRVTVGNVLVLIAWAVISVSGYARIQADQQQVRQQLSDQREALTQTVRELNLVQQNVATDTAIIRDFEERLRRDEDEIDGKEILRGK